VSGQYTSRRLVLNGWGSEEEVLQFAAEPSIRRDARVILEHYDSSSAG
jgi:hypothetical protein